MANTSIKGSVGKRPKGSAPATISAGVCTVPELLTPKECAAYRRCSLRKLDRERADGAGCPFVRIDNRIFYRRADIDRFIEAHLRGGELRDRNGISAVRASGYGLDTTTPRSSRKTK